MKYATYCIRSMAISQVTLCHSVLLVKNWRILVLHVQVREKMLEFTQRCYLHRLRTMH